MTLNDDLNAFKVDIEPRKVIITSEPYIIFTARGYQPVVKVYDSKARREYFMYISAASLARPLEILRNENSGNFVGLEFWISKESSDRTAKYVIEE